MSDAKQRRRPRGRHWATILTVGLFGGAAAEAGPPHKSDAKPGGGLVPRGLPLGAEARKEIAHRVLTHPDIALGAPGHRLAVIRLTLGTARAASGEARTIATVVLFDHTAGEARRVLLDVGRGQLLANTRLPGRPQGSREEFEEAAQIIRRDHGLARLLEQGAVLDGGFIVADPGGSRRRAMQLKLLSADRLTLLRSITVDLTRGVITAPDTGEATAAVPTTTVTAVGTKGGIR